MGDIVQGIFNPGKASRDAAKAQERGTDKAMAEVRRSVQEAKTEIKPRFEQASNYRLKRLGQMASMLEGGFAPQMAATQQGNMQAQNVLSGGGVQAANAILGQPMDMSYMTPQGINFSPAEFLANLEGLQQLKAEGQQAAQESPQMQATTTANIGRTMGLGGYDGDMSGLLGGLFNSRYGR